MTSNEFRMRVLSKLSEKKRAIRLRRSLKYFVLLRYRYRFTSIDLFENFYNLSCVQFFCHISALLANIPIQIILIHSSVYQLFRVHAVANIHAKILVDNWYSSG